MIGLPLRLLAREIYDRIVDRVGADAVALITGEEKIVPPRPRFWSAPSKPCRWISTSRCLAVDEIQLCADPERGHVFTDRLLHARGAEETLLLGADTMRPILERLVPTARVIERRPRLSTSPMPGRRS